MNLTNLDLDILRTLVLAEDLGGFAKAAERLGRTPSAVSLQMKRLQEDVGVPLFFRQGRKNRLTEQGEIALRYARRVMGLNDEMLDTLRGASLSGVMRVGFAEDFVGTVLPQALSRFSSLYPHVRLEVKIDRNVVLETQIEASELDIALTLGASQGGTATKIGELGLCWVASPTFTSKQNERLPLLMFEDPCIFRKRALDALDSVQRPWRIAMTSPSLNGLWAAVGIGLGVTVRAKTIAPVEFGCTIPDMPPLGTIGVTLHRRTSVRAAFIRRFADIVEELAEAQCKSHFRP